MATYTSVLDALIARWRGAFERAESAIAAARFDLPAAEVRLLHRHLTDERTDVQQALGELLQEAGNVRPAFLGVLTSRKSTKALLGLRADVKACIFNVDGVLVPSAAIHADAWRDVFNEFIARRVERTGGVFSPFSRRLDYPELIHGKSRNAAVRDFLASRGISLPEGTPHDPADAETVYGLANRKNEALLRRIEQPGVSAYDGARLYLELARDAGVRCAVVSGSTTTRALLERAGLTAWVDECIDGRTMLEERLERKPAPDMLLAACHHLRVAPAHAAAFETGRDGIAAAHGAHFALVVAVDHEGRGPALLEAGADDVVSDLGEVLERQLRDGRPETHSASPAAGRVGRG